MEIITRAYAKTKGLPRYYTGEPCIKGHVSERYTTNSGCVECQQIINKKPRKKPKPAEPEFDYAQIGKAIMDHMERLRKLAEEGIESRQELRQLKADNKKLTDKIGEQHDKILKLNQKISQLNQASSRVPDNKFKLSEIATIR